MVTALKSSNAKLLQFCVHMLVCLDMFYSRSQRVKAMQWR